MSSLHINVSANVKGRDFVVGDLHGCFDLLEDELSRVGFDSGADRLFSVGDLIDRGPYSLECLRLLRESWFYAVRGNHEAMLLDHYATSTSPYGYRDATRLFFRNGGHWVQELDADTRQELIEDLLPRVVALPYVMSVATPEGQFHVVHAELMTGGLDDGWLAALSGRPEDRTPECVLTDDNLTDDVLSTMLEPLIWGRRLWRQVESNGSRTIATPAGPLLVSQSPVHRGLSLTYVGHTPFKLMLQHRSHLFIDQGAYERDKKSCLLLLEHSAVRTWLNDSSS